MPWLCPFTSSRSLLAAAYTTAEATPSPSTELISTTNGSTGER